MDRKITPIRWTPMCKLDNSPEAWSDNLVNCHYESAALNTSCQLLRDKALMD